VPAAFAALPVPPPEGVYVVRPSGPLRHVPQLHSLKAADVRQNLYNEVAAYWERVAAGDPFVSDLSVR
jgi:hypothetical protein